MFPKQNKSFQSGDCYKIHKYMIIILLQEFRYFYNFSNEKIIDHIGLREKFWMMAREICLDSYNASIRKF